MYIKCISFYIPVYKASSHGAHGATHVSECLALTVRTRRISRFAYCHIKAMHGVTLAPCRKGKHIYNIIITQYNNHLVTPCCRGKQVYKMPTGLVHDGEDIHIAAEREVLEETGIHAK